MIVDLKEKEISGRFDLKGGGWVELRLLSISDLKEMRAACVKPVSEYPLLEGEDGKKEYRRFEGTNFDADLWNEMLWDKTIKAWGDIYDRNEKAIPVTKDNKILLMTLVQEFSEAHTDGMKALKKTEQTQAEASEKN